MKRLLILLFFIFSLTLLVGVIFMPPWNLSINKIHSNIEKIYQEVQHVDTVTLSKMNRNNVVIFDVREPQEFNVSHIEGAIQISPSIAPEEFEYEFSEIISGKIVVFYCSVGVRSSVQADQLSDIVNNANAKSSYNLKGGIFQWHNESLPLVKETNISTNKVHPYNDYWGQLISSQNLVSY